MKIIYFIFASEIAAVSLSKFKSLLSDKLQNLPSLSKLSEKFSDLNDVQPDMSLFGEDTMGMDFGSLGKENFQKPKFNITENYIDMVQRSKSNSNDPNGVSMMRNFIMMSLKEEKFSKSEVFMKNFLEDPSRLVTQSIMLAMVTAYDDYNSKFDMATLILMLEFIEQECPDQFASKMEKVMPFIFDLEQSTIGRMIIILLVESFGEKRILSNDIIFKEIFEDTISTPLSNILTDTILALMSSKNDPSSNHEKLGKIGSLLRLAQMPCSGNRDCLNLKKDFGLVALRLVDYMTKSDTTKMILFTTFNDRSSLIDFIRIEREWFSRCGKIAGISVTTTASPFLLQMEDLKAQAATFSPRDMLKQYVPTLQNNDNDVSLSITTENSASSEVNSEQPLSIESKNDIEGAETTIIEEYLENVDSDQLKKQLDDMKSMMLELGIDEDDAFKQLEDEINSFSEGSGSLAGSLLDFF